MKKTIRKEITWATCKPIIGENMVRNFVHHCVHTLKLGLGFHVDTPFEDYVEYKSGKATFTSDESDLLNKSMTEACQQSEELGLDIYGIGLDLIQPMIEEYKRVPSWEVLSVYRYAIYPNQLAITTDASEEVVEKCWDEFREISDPQENFDEYITRTTGCFAISGTYEERQFML